VSGGPSAAARFLPGLAPRPVGDPVRGFFIERKEMKMTSFRTLIAVAAASLAMAALVPAAQAQTSGDEAGNKAIVQLSL
jgi:hypothetical protein